jgi:hypothetical protein
VTVEKNKTLPDASIRERVILVTMAVAIVFMGIASPLFTRRMEASVNNIIEQTSAPRNASRPAAVPLAPPIAGHVVTLPTHPVLATLAEKQVRP